MKVKDVNDVTENWHMYFYGRHAYLFLTQRFQVQPFVPGDISRDTYGHAYTHCLIAQHCSTPNEQRNNKANKFGDTVSTTRLTFRIGQGQI